MRYVYELIYSLQLPCKSVWPVLSHRWGNWGTQRLRNTFKITQLVTGGVRFELRKIAPRMLCSESPGAFVEHFSLVFNMFTTLPSITPPPSPMWTSVTVLITCDWHLWFTHQFICWPVISPGPQCPMPQKLSVNERASFQAAGDRFSQDPKNEINRRFSFSVFSSCSFLKYCL